MMEQVSKILSDDESNNSKTGRLYNGEQFDLDQELQEESVFVSEGMLVK